MPRMAWSRSNLRLFGSRGITLAGLFGPLKYVIEFTRVTRGEPAQIWGGEAGNQFELCHRSAVPEGPGRGWAYPVEGADVGWKKDDSFASPWSYGSFYLADPPTFDIVNLSAGATIDSTRPSFPSVRLAR